MRRIILALLLVPLAAIIKTQIPDIRRYLRIKAM